DKYKDSSCTQPWSASDGDYFYIKVGTEDITLYAKWADTNCVLTLDSNAGDNGYFCDDQTFDTEVKVKTIGAANGKETETYVTNPKNRDKHYKFKGWYSDKACTKLVAAAGDYSTDLKFTINADTTYYAGWESAYKTVTFDAGDGYVDYYDEDLGRSVKKAKTAVFVVKDGRFSCPEGGVAMIDDPGKTFDGWYVNGTKVTDIYSYTVTKDTTFTARYADSLSVTFNYNGGYREEWDSDAGKYVHKTDNLVLKVVKGKRIGEYTYINDPEHDDENKVFSGWFLKGDTEHKDRINAYDYVPTQNVELVAFWANKFTVTFDAGNGRINGQQYKKYTALEGTYFRYNNGAGIPAEPVIADENRVFEAWYTSTVPSDDTRVSREDILDHKVTGNITYYAGYKDAWTVTFNPNGGTIVSKETDNSGNYKVKIAKGETIRGKVPTVKSTDTVHKVFKGWFANPELTGEPVDVYSMAITQSMTLYAGWSECFKITFHTNKQGATFANGKDSVVVLVEKGEAYRYGEESGDKKEDTDAIYNAPKITNKNGGYHFPGWYDNSNCTGTNYRFSYYDNMYGFKPVRDMDFYAKWSTGAVKVTFDANGAEFSPYSKSYKYNAEYESELSADNTKWIVFVPKGITFSEVGYPSDFKYDTKPKNSWEWAYKEKTCKNKLSGDYAFNADQTVYVRWYDAGSGGGGGGGKSFEITFHAGEGYFYNNRDDKTTKYSCTWGTDTWYSAPEPYLDDETRAFKGWYYDADHRNPYPEEWQKVEYSYGYWNYNVKYPEKVTDLYACYGPANTIVFDANGGYFDNDINRIKDPGVDLRETTILKDKVYPGQSVIISNYTKRVRRDGDKLFGGWYTDRACTDNAKVVVYAVDSSGELYKPSGSVTLYAKWIDYKQAVKVTASAASTTIDIGESVNLTAAVNPETAGGNVHWFVSSYSCGKSNTDHKAPLKLDIDGKATGLAQGTCYVYAEVNGVRSDELTINVTNETVTSTITLTDKDGKEFNGVQDIISGRGLIVKGVITPAESADDLAGAVKWESSDTSVATVEKSGNGADAVVTGVGEGEATITATLGKKSASVKVKVIKPVMLSKSKLTMTVKADLDNALTASFLKDAAETSVKAYADDEYKEESNLVTLVLSEFMTSGIRKTQDISIKLTEQGKNIDAPQKIYIVAKAKIENVDLSATCVLTLNPPLVAGAVHSNIPSDSVVNKGTRILLNSESADTDIYYALGTDLPGFDEQGRPDAKTLKFGDAIIVNANVTINAVAVRTGRKNSAVSTFIYRVENWGDAEPYKEAFGNDLSTVPSDMWYVLCGTVYKTAGDGTTSIAKPYTGAKQTFDNEIAVFYGTSLLLSGRDYTLSYANNQAVMTDLTNKKAPSFTIKGKGNFTGTSVFKFKITKAPMSDAKLTSDPVVTIEAGPSVVLSKKVNPKLTFAGKAISAKKDYTLEFYSGDAVDPEKLIADAGKEYVKEAGSTYTVRVAALAGGSFDGTGATFTVKSVAKNDATVIQLGKYNVFDQGNKKSLKIDAFYLANAETKAKYYKADGTLDLVKIFDNSTSSNTPLAYVRLSAKTDPLLYGRDYTVEAAPATAAGKLNYTVIGTARTLNDEEKATGVKSVVGSKTGSITINGGSFAKVRIAGLFGSVEYKGKAFTLNDLFNADDKVVKANGFTGVTPYIIANGKTVALTQGVDYVVSAVNTGSVGKFTVTFKGIGQFAGGKDKTVNVTVKAYNIKKDARKKFVVSVNGIDQPYSKAGVTPKVTVTYDGMLLKEGIDYKLSYKNNTQLVSDYNIMAVTKRPKAIIKGLGGFTGTKEDVYFNIKSADAEGSLTLTANDVVYNSRGTSGYFLATPYIIDNGAEVKTGTGTGIDSLSGIQYFYAEDVKLSDNTTKAAGDAVSASDKVPAGTMIEVHAIANITKAAAGFSEPYYVQGGDSSLELTCFYRVIEAAKDLSKAKASIKKGVTCMYCNGDEVIPLKSGDIVVTLGSVTLNSEDYEIVSVTNNRFLGNATAILRGRGAYGGTTKLTFKINAKNVKGN
ncbi:MAG: InlB B-repeat-containing protein, partial [Lachnospiraceae bacterium]|nr:InlB B-repeat-containing protein [Lachnospiraceae bacterium]